MLLASEDIKQKQNERTNGGARRYYTFNSLKSLLQRNQTMSRTSSTLAYVEHCLEQQLVGQSFHATNSNIT